MFTKERLESNERGFASFVVALTLILILSLVTVGFAQLIRREQQNALNKQLSTQAFYAAETGVNDAVKAYETCSGSPGGCTSAELGDGQNCDSLPATGILSKASQTIDSANNVAYTCVLVNPGPSNIDYSSVDTNSSKVVTVGASASIASIKVSWQGTNTNPGNVFPNDTGGHFPTQTAAPASQMAVTGVLRFSVTPLVSFTRDNLIKNTCTAFLYPAHAASPPVGTSLHGVDYGECVNPASPSKQGQIVSGGCNTGQSGVPRDCNVDISFPAPFAANTQYLLRIGSIYYNSAVTLTAYAADGTTKIPLTGGQIMIDATGKAQDVLRRIQVRIPVSNPFNFPDYALEAGDVCKRIQANSSTSTVDNTGATVVTGPCAVNKP